MKTISDIVLLNVKTFDDEREGFLSVLEPQLDFKIDIKRFFYIHGTQRGQIRGKHAHKQAHQILICMNGKCDVVCDDSKNKKTFSLTSPQQALLIPPSIWAEQKYINKNSVLFVASDRLYEPDDYIRNYDDFLKYRNL